MAWMLTQLAAEPRDLGLRLAGPWPLAGVSPARATSAPGRLGRIQSFFIYETDVETFGLDLGFLASLLGSHQLEPQIGVEVSWRDIGTALAALRDRRVTGKAVLLVD